MHTRARFAVLFALAATLAGGALTMAATGTARPQGPCDIYAAAGDACVAAHSTTRALYAAYNGPLYQVMRQSDGRKLNIGVVSSTASDAGGYADAAAQDRFCANTICWITTIYDQARKGNDLTQAPRGAFSGPAMGGFNNIPVADMAPISVMGHKVYGAFIEPGMGLRQDDAKGTAVDDQAEGQYWVINGKHFNSGCCFDYGNAETDSRDDNNGTMETAYFGDAPNWYHGSPPGPWVMTDQENNLVGCVNPDGANKLCNLPNITSRFVTAMAKGEAHHWTSMGGDSQKGPLQVMFDGPRVNITYDPMRKQGAILLGNGGDNSNGSQGTFYEGAMTKAGTFPSDATDQRVQANVVAARYAAAPLSIAAAPAMPTGLQTFAPGSSQDATVTFTNVTGAAVSGLKLGITAPAKGWTATAMGGASFANVAPGASVSATFHVTSGAASFNGDLVANASWSGGKSEKASETVRNVSPIRINEYRLSDGTADNATNSFIELYNAGSDTTDISGWSLTQHQTQQAVFGAAKIPAGTHLAAHGFYLFGLSTSGLAGPARAGDGAISVRSIAGMKAGDTVSIDTGAGAESRRIASVGTAAEAATTLWQPLPDGPLITIAKGATNVPVTSTAGFVVGQKIALGYGATYPAVSRSQEHYEVATVTSVGKPGTQALTAADAVAGATNLKVTNVANLSAGDRIRLDITSMGHGVETVTVRNVGTAASRSALAGDAAAGATQIEVRSVAGLAVGQTLNIGTPASRQTVTIAAIAPGAAPPAGGRGGRGGAPGGVTISPALARAHENGEDVVQPGTGLELAAPLKFAHAANMPFSARGTGIGFTPAAAFAHTSNEPIQALGTGVTLDRPLARAHGVDAVVHDGAVSDAGYQGSPAPNQWFGGPVLSTSAGAMVLRDAAGHVVDSLNYGLMVDPWAGQGYQAVSGAGEGGCRATAPGVGRGGRGAAPILINSSSGRFPDGRDSGSNCTDFRVQGATTLSDGSAAGATNIKVASVTAFSAGQTVVIDAGANRETATIATVGTAGASTADAATDRGATSIGVASAAGFSAGQAITVDSGAGRETATIAAVAGGRGAARITLAAPLAQPHASGAQVAGSGITLTAALGRAHADGAQVLTNVPTPGAPNRY